MAPTANRHEAGGCPARIAATSAGPPGLKPVRTRGFRP